jgi:hypothetical protein
MLVNRRVISGLAVFGLGLAASVPLCAADTAAPVAVISREQIEQDWLRQDIVRTLPPATPRPVPSVTTQQDAAGGCDGVKTGRFGFHTAADDQPWWQVDLGASQPLEKALIYNRGDGNVELRAAHLRVLLSSDGTSWTLAQQHDGKKFGGPPDNSPLTVPLNGTAARFLRVQLPEKQYFHLDEVEVYRMGCPDNVALKKPADQSSVSQWSSNHLPAESAAPVESLAPATYPLPTVVERGRQLAESLRSLGAPVDEGLRTLEQAAEAWQRLPAEASAEDRRRIYFQARWAVRRLALTNPLLDFDDLLFVKRAPGSFTHMSDQYYGWFSRPGGGLFVLEKFKTDQPQIRCLSGDLPLGNVLRPDLSYDGKKVLFAHCKYYPGLAGEPDKLNKANVPEDAFYHLYEINLDGTGLRRLTRGKYDDFDGRYLPDGRIVFLSTRRGQAVQTGKTSAAECIDGAQPDSYVRCGGGASRPVAVYTLHVIDGDGANLAPISAFEMFEWTPSIDHEGRILYARWDYVDRHNMPFMKLWSTLPDGTNPQTVWGNFVRSPHCAFEPRAIPHSHKIVFTASGHHAHTGGPLALLDPRRGADHPDAITRLTPEVCYPEAEGWPQSYFAGPYPLSEDHYLVSWSYQPLPPGTPRPDWGMPGPPNDLGLYLFDRFGNLDLLYRDPEIGSETPLPVKPRLQPPRLRSPAEWAESPEGRMLLVNVYEGLDTVSPGTIRKLRLVGVPPKTHPVMNNPNLGVTNDDPGKFVLGTVPVELDGSAWFRVPAGVTFFLQALDERGVAVQTMRSGTYVQPGQSASCIGCHEPRTSSPRNLMNPAALRHEPSKITPGPAGSWPLDYQVLIQPVLDRHCVSCHTAEQPEAKGELTAAKSYNTLLDFGRPSLRDHVRTRYAEGRSIVGGGAAATSPLLALLGSGHADVDLRPDDWDRLITWMDTYGQRLGSFDKQQEHRLLELRQRMAAMMNEPR